MTMHPALTHLQPLVGTWKGQGHGGYPTIEGFDYVDEWQFIDVGKPFLLFIEKTWNADGSPMHTETGYIRCPSPETIEIIAAIPTGQAEVGVGGCVISEARLELSTDARVLASPSAKRVDRIVRRFRLTGDELTYEMDMSAVGQGLTLHLSAQLTRQP